MPLLYHNGHSILSKGVDNGVATGALAPPDFSDNYITDILARFEERLGKIAACHNPTTIIAFE